MRLTVWAPICPTHMFYHWLQGNSLLLASHSLRSISLGSTTSSLRSKSTTRIFVYSSSKYCFFSSAGGFFPFGFAFDFLQHRREGDRLRSCTSRDRAIKDNEWFSCRFIWQCNALDTLDWLVMLYEKDTHNLSSGIEVYTTRHLNRQTLTKITEKRYFSKTAFTETWTKGPLFLYLSPNSDLWPDVRSLASTQTAVPSALYFHC